MKKSKKRVEIIFITTNYNKLTASSIQFLTIVSKTVVQAKFNFKPMTKKVFIYRTFGLIKTAKNGGHPKICLSQNKIQNRCSQESHSTNMEKYRNWLTVRSKKCATLKVFELT